MTSSSHRRDSSMMQKAIPGKKKKKAIAEVIPAIICRNSKEISFYQKDL